MYRQLLCVALFCFTHTLKAQVDIDSLHREFQTAQQDTSKVMILVALSKFYLPTEGEKSLQYGKEALQLAEETAYQNGLIASYNNLGKYYATIASDYDRAEMYFQKLLTLYKAQNNEIEIAQTFNSLGVTAQFKGDYISSLDYLLKSLNSFDKLEDEKRAALVIVNISSIYRFLNDYKKANEYNDKALEIYEKLHKEDPDNKRTHQKYAYALLTKGVIYKETGEPKKALENFKKSLAIEEIYQNKNALANICNNVASAYFDLKDFDNAEKFYRRSSIERKGLGENIGTSRTFIGLSKVKIQQNKYSEALIFAKKSFHLSNKLNAKENVKKSSFLLYELFKNLGRIDSSLYYHEIYTTTKDSLFNIEKKQVIGSLEHDFELQQKALVNEKQATGLAAKEASLQFHKQINIAVIVIIALVSLILVAIYGAYKNQSRFNNILMKNRNVITLQNLEIKKQNVSILTQKEELEKLNKIKDKLLSIISHDFRSPLNSLKGTLVLLTMDGLSSKEIRDISLQLKDKVDTTSILLENLLTWAKSQMKGFTIKKELINICELTEENLLLFNYQIAQKKVKIRHQENCSKRVIADSNMVRLVIRNLISNAVKFVNYKGSITLENRVFNRFLEVKVTNTGNGISQEDQAKLFQENSNYSTMGTDKEVGTGLGLLLCKEFIEVNGGSIYLESTPEECTSVVFTLPIPQEDEGTGLELGKSPANANTRQ